MLLAQLTPLPEAASTYAEAMDRLFWFLCGVTGFFTLLIATLIIVFMIRYRRGAPGRVPQQIEGSLRLEIFWTAVPFVIAMFIFAWSARLYVMWAQPPEGALEVYVVGRQWMWHLQHAQGQREINQLHVPVGRPVKLTMTSKDVIHSFFVPEFRIHMDVVPGRYNVTWFEATKTGTFHLFCSQYCGTNHSVMIGEVIVMEPDAYERWLANRAGDSLADKGRKLFQKLQCVSCHSADSRARAPVLEGLYKTDVALEDGTTVRADDDYLRESILYPEAKIVRGFRPIMPSFKGIVDEQEMNELLAFLRTLGPGQTPPRVENAEPPEARPATTRPKEKQP
jgi:cytochrome c oxidase subunit 2